MHVPAGVAAIAFLFLSSAEAQSNLSTSDGFAGVWRYNSERSELRRLPAPPAAFLKVEQDARSLHVFASDAQDGSFALVSIYPLDGRSERRQVGADRLNSATKWEGAALLVNTLVSGARSYTVMERWKRSRDGSTLTITRTIVDTGGETESTLVYENTAAAAPEPEAPAQQPLPATPGWPQRSAPAGAGAGLAASDAGRASAPQPVLRASRPESDADAEWVVESGSRVLLRLTNPLNTKHCAAGDRVYMETAVPVFVRGRLVIPAGSYVTGSITESHQAGRVKGRAGLNIRIDSLTLPNGVARDFRSRVGSTEGTGKTGPEGEIQASGNKGHDAGTVAQTTAAGAGIGSVIGAASGHTMKGLGIGSAAGAAAGLASILATRGSDVVLPRGSTLELVLERELRYRTDEINWRVQ